MTRENRITLALQQAPKNDTEARECRALGITVEVNADMLALLQEDNAKLTKERDDLRDWMKCANQFAWAHERICPRHDSDKTCTCGLDQFLGRPRPTIESWKSKIQQIATETRTRADELYRHASTMRDKDIHTNKVVSTEMHGIAAKLESALTSR